MLYNKLHTRRIASVLCSWPRSHTIRPRPSPLTSELTWICRVTASCGTPGLLFFRCTVCPTGSLQTPSKHKELALVFFSSLEPITLTPGAVTQRNGVPMLYDTASSSNLPACTFAWRGTSWAGCHSRGESRHASCEGTGLQPCLAALETARELWLTAGMELETAAGFMRSTFKFG